MKRKTCQNSFREGSRQKNARHLTDAGHVTIEYALYIAINLAMQDKTLNSALPRLLEDYWQVEGMNLSRVLVFIPSLKI